MAGRGPVPENEQQRLAALHGLGVLDSAPTPAIDDLTRLAAYVCHTPIALVVLLDADRQWVKSRAGDWDIRESPRALSFCTHTICQRDPLIVPDTRADPRFADNPFVTGEPHIRFYAGAQLRTANGHAIGTLCVIDRQPRQLDGDQEAALRVIARQVLAQLERAAERTILETIEDGFVALDRGWRYLYVNRRAGEMFGRDPDRLIGKNIWDEFPEGRDQPFARAYRRAMDEQRMITLEDYYQPWDRWFENRIYPTPSGLSIFFTEITARKVAELELARQRAQLQAMLDSMVEGVFACDREGRLIFANAAELRLAGIERATGADLPTIIERLAVRNLDGTPMRPEESVLGKALRGETALDHAGIVRDPGTGTDRVLRANAAPIRDAEGNVTGAVMVARDVTELVELERLKDEFLSVAAHELKTPVAVVKAYAELVREVEGSERDRILDGLRRGADRIDGVVTALLDLSQLDLDRLQLHPTSVELEVLVRATVERVQRNEPAHHVAVDELAHATVRADPSRVRQVLTALLSNAIKFSDAPADVHVGLRVDQGRAIVSVRDRGAGIPDDRRDRIFERFYRAHTHTARDTGGMGVGLHLARALVTRQGGAMWFESEAERGSTFYFSLPSS